MKLSAWKPWVVSYYHKFLHIVRLPNHSALHIAIIQVNLALAAKLHTYVYCKNGHNRIASLLAFYIKHSYNEYTLLTFMFVCIYKPLYDRERLSKK